MASWRSSAALLGLLLAPRLGAAAEPPRVGVVIQTAVNLTADKQVELGERVKDALTRALVVDVTAGREVARRLDARGLPADCFERAECRARVARTLEVQEILLISAVRVGTRLQLEPTWVDVASGRVVGRDAVVADSVKDDLSEVLRRAAPAWLPHAAPRPPPAPPAAVAAPSETATVATAPPAVAPARGPPLGTWVAAGVAVVALAAGVGLGASARADFDALEADGCDVVACDPARADRVDDKALAADLFFVTAGAAALTGAVWWWLDDGDDGLITGPAVGEGQLGWTLRGRF